MQRNIGKHNRIGKTRDIFKKIGAHNEISHARMGMIKERNGKELTKAEDIKKSGKHTQKTV